jgi:hypothetical protein
MAQVYPGQYVGYYEISYWHSDYFDTYAITENVDAFSNVDLFVDEALPGLNFEHLFLTYDILSRNVFSDPPANSLFNIDNFKMLIDLGMSSPNILGADYALRYGIDFQLSSDWYILTS